MAFAIPVQRGNFSFNGDLYADAGDFNRHKRASVAELTDILRPELKKSKPIDGAKTRDEPAHFFAAQCLHCGLAPSKQKATSKMRLLDALNKSKLALPAHIVHMESDMKKEYATAERKAKAIDDGTSPAKKARSQQPMTQKDSGPTERPKQFARSNKLDAVWKHAIEYGLPTPRTATKRMPYHFQWIPSP